MQRLPQLVLLTLMSAIFATVAVGEESEPVGDTALERAETLVEQSDRYLHHSHLKRGMTGYGLSVFEGTEIERFDVEIISVIPHYTPQQDVILARLSGQGLEHSGIIAGMSGSPVYVRDPSDGKEKLIGAVAMGWSAQKDPICGIQPITQMLAVAENGGRDDGPPVRVADGESAASRSEFLSTVLDPHKRDFAGLIASRMGQRSQRTDDSHPQLRPLATPLAVSGASPPVLRKLRETLSAADIMPVQVGGGGSTDAPEIDELELQPGSVLVIPVIEGDVEWFASGTVTDVTDERVLAFGHGLLSSGELELPMGPGAVHTVVPHLLRSFKLAAPGKIAGSLTRDESAAVMAEIGREPVMVPMTVRVLWTDTGRQQTFRYRVCRHHDLTGLLAGSLVYESGLAWHEAPLHHTVRYTVRTDYAGLGAYEASNVSRGWNFARVSSDLTRPLYSLEFNPFGEPPKLESIEVEMTVSPGDSGAEILELRLDSRTYRPGDTVTGSVVIRPFRQERVSLPVSFELPEDLPEGKHQLMACDNTAATESWQREMPHKFDPQTIEELYAALNRVVELPADCLYLRLPLQSRGLALRHEELPDIPASRADIIARAETLRTHGFAGAKVRRVRTDYVLRGSVLAEFEVRERPAETLLQSREGAGK
ncbi:MAG: hypothetical protein ACP5HU_10715 [Phycisphaerae bacterium]